MQTQPQDLALLLLKWARPFAELPSPYSPLSVSDVQVRWNARMRSRAGVCRPNERMIELNPHLLKEVKDLEEVFVHEMCHMAVSLKWPRAESHGIKWKKLMVHMGFEPKRCHDFMPLKRHVQRRWAAACECREHKVSTRVLNKMKKGIRYKCVDCNSVLETQLPGPRTRDSGLCSGAENLTKIPGTGA